MHVISILTAALAGAAAFGLEGAVLGGVIGYLAAEVMDLKKRLTLLEKELPPEPLETATLKRKTPADAAERKKDTPAKELPSEQRKAPSKSLIEKSKMKAGVRSPREEGTSPPVLDGLFESLGSYTTTGTAWLKQFITGGNPVLKVGLIVLFIGVAFLLKYAAQRNLLPIEYRLAAAGLGGAVLLVLGYRLRSQPRGYGTLLQGGGVGILYLVVFAAAKLYHLLPPMLALLVMIGLVVLSAALAVLQDSRGLAFFGAFGGFIAPVLMSTGEGSHVMLFSYFGLLNITIVVIAWFKAWRELNLLGFFFTFGIATLWGSKGYQPQFFLSTEPFLIAYFLFYCFVSVLFAHRQPVNLRGYIDGPLVFGLPLVVSALQYALVKDTEYGMAFSALGFGIFYLLLATVLWHRLAEGMRLLCEAFLALGIVFATLTIPLALDSELTSGAWALEGAAMVWVGVRQNRVLARLFAILLQLGAAWVFIENVSYPFGLSPFINRHFIGCFFLASSALFSSYYIYMHLEKLKKWERFIALPMLIWGMGWWYFGGLREVDRHYTSLGEHNTFLLYSCASVLLMSAIAKRVNWREFGIAQLVLLPAMVFSMLVGMIGFRTNSHFLQGWGVIAWSAAFLSQYSILYLFDSDWPERLAGWYHAAVCWLLLFFICFEVSWLIDVYFGGARVWSIIVWGIVPSIALLALIRWTKDITWPFQRWRHFYQGVAANLLVVFLAFWNVFTLREAGLPLPITYIPFVNPLELTQFFVILVFLSWYTAGRKTPGNLPVFLPSQSVMWGIGVLAFLWINGVVARSVHFYAGIPYYFEPLYYSVVLQSAIAAVWGLIALTVTIWATRIGNRLLWLCGASLLGLVVAKLFLVDLSGTGTVARIVSFLSVGILMLIIGYFSPMPPKKNGESP